MKSLLSCSCSSDSSFGDPRNLLMSRTTLWTVSPQNLDSVVAGMSVSLVLNFLEPDPIPKARIFQYLVMNVPTGQQVSSYWISRSEYSSKKLGSWGRGVSSRLGLNSQSSSHAKVTIVYYAFLLVAFSPPPPCNWLAWIEWNFNSCLLILLL